VLLYASYLSKDYDVLAIAVSGQDESTLRMTHHLHLRGATKAVDYPDARTIVSFDDYYQAFVRSEIKFRQDYRALLDYSRKLNSMLQAKKVTEAERGFLISGILIGLQNEAFVQSYRAHRTGRQLATALLQTIRAEFESAKLLQDRRDELAQSFSFLTHTPALTQDKEFFVTLIQGINDNINTFMRTHEYYDTIGQFYVEFLRYANNDKGLGIVLTPPHIAELFADLAEVNRDSIVFDNCCGTAGLLIAAMQTMIRDAGPDRALQKRIKDERLFGIEYQPKVYALAVSNMILHGDGKTNILRADCFTDALRKVAPHEPTVGLLNPPYKSKTVKEDKEELEYVLNNLNCLVQGGKCVAIVPITCATAPSGAISGWKRAILKSHTLEAVLSMPIELFHNSNATVVTCIMVFTAHRPHPSGKKTWFGYWRDDGFVKTKHRGRFDARDTWPAIRKAWVSAYRSREIVDGASVMREVGPEDEWCAEAYLETDYSRITQSTVVEAVKKYLLRHVTLKHVEGSRHAEEE
jgi:type I restriction-modification system DNA methylase subunit